MTLASPRSGRSLFAVVERDELDALRGRVLRREGDVLDRGSRRRSARPAANSLWRTLTTCTGVVTSAGAERVAGEDRALVRELAALGLHAADVRRVAGAELRGDARREVLAEGARGDDDDVEAAALGDRGDGRREALGDGVREVGVVADEDLRGAEAGDLGGGGLGALAEDEDGEGAAAGLAARR